MPCIENLFRLSSPCTSRCRATLRLFLQRFQYKTFDGARDVLETQHAKEFEGHPEPLADEVEHNA